MLRIWTIGFSLLLLLSGMNLTIATHYCHGERAATLVNFSGEPASCGMESGNTGDHPHGTSLSRLCCEDDLAAYSIDANYCPSEYPAMLFQGQPQQANAMVASDLYFYIDRLSLRHSSTGPPGPGSRTQVSLAGICVFRI